MPELQAVNNQADEASDGHPAHADACWTACMYAYM